MQKRVNYLFFACVLKEKQICIDIYTFIYE